MVFYSKSKWPSIRNILLLASWSRHKRLKHALYVVHNYVFIVKMNVTKHMSRHLFHFHRCELTWPDVGSLILMEEFELWKWHAYSFFCRTKCKGHAWRLSKWCFFYVGQLHNSTGCRPVQSQMLSGYTFLWPWLWVVVVVFLWQVG